MELRNAFGPPRRRRASIGTAAASLGLATALCLASSPSLAETRGYVISWFATATYIPHFPDNTDNCPQDRNKGRTELDIRRLTEVGYSQEQATHIVGSGFAHVPDEVFRRVVENTRVNGKPGFSIYNYPDATPDPNIETVTGKYAWGFDLGGTNAANKFEDPETHQKVDNQLWRAVGCTESFHSTPPVLPYPEEIAWNVMIDAAPAWTLRISGDDLTHDGKVTVTLDRATQHLIRAGNGSVLIDATYILDGSPRSHNVFQGEIKDGVLTITPANLYLEGQLPYYFEIALRNTHMRINAQPDGKLQGYWGGYLDWKNFIYMFTARPSNGADSIGLYHAVEKMADSNPDPKTGQNRDISTTFRMEAVPAYLAQSEGKLIKIVALPALAARAPQDVATRADKIGAKSLVELAVDKSTPIPFATPPGITLVDVIDGRDRFLRRRLGDAQGNPLYTYERDGTAGKSSCFDACVEEFPPLMAAAGASSSGDWSLMSRPGGKQWAYLGQPLYGYSGQTASAKAAMAPKPGWKQAIFTPAKSVKMPFEFRLESLEAAGGYAFVLAATGMPVYVLAGAPRDPTAWIPAYASDLAGPVGDFSIVESKDGTRQWAFRGHRLFSYQGDYSATDLNGLLAQSDVHLALAYRYFMPASLAINIVPMRGPVMTTAKGLSVYTEARYHLQYGGREARGGYTYSYADAKAVGAGGCSDDCAKMWRPVAAPATAQSSGFWEVATRPDGSRQWAYKGAALYTYVGDKAPGDIDGNNRDVVVYGDAQGQAHRYGNANGSANLSLTGGNVIDPSNFYGAFGSGFYWHLVPIFTLTAE